MPCLLLSFCSSPAKFERAKDLYEKEFKKNGVSFYRTDNYKKVITDLKAVPSSDPQYSMAQQLATKIQDDFREHRIENVKLMMEKTKEAIRQKEEMKKSGQLEQKPYSEMTEEDKAKISGK